MRDLTKEVSRSRPKNFHGVWCELCKKPCIHPAPDGLENCRFCEEYSLLKLLKREREK